MSIADETTVGLLLAPGVVLSLSPSAAHELVTALGEGGRMLRLAEGAQLALDDVRAPKAIRELCAQLVDDGELTS